MDNPEGKRGNDSSVAIDDSNVAIDGSYVGRKHKDLLLFCFGPTVDPLIAIEMDDLFEENLDLWYYFDFFKQMIHLLQQIGHLLFVRTKLNCLLLFYLLPTNDHLLQQMDNMLEENSMFGIVLLSLVHLLARVANVILFNSRNHGHKSDPTVDLIKRELPGAIAVKREAPTGGADDVATYVGVDVDVDVKIGDVGAKSGGEHVDDAGGIYGGFTPSRIIHSIKD
ncbi:hypothetical protein H5410_005127 [Solanum commersonii]|uniref:Uncharacterized protein n=1 Tax=Solanum commersonii TaxID=4109 RepID=A0A9J6A5T0_SOLCO|nr:hypothetical protein H5410_005127 [Solanum commersonii]